ncbi:MAG TPA: hypothetical protein VK663_12125 [Burkholderiales bacterium]|nr:hypothetical protein [Burkholderiales bacterium]
MQHKMVLKKHCRQLLVAMSALVVSISCGWAAQDAEIAPASRKPEAKNMRLVGYNDLQARSAYQPLVHHQGTRWIAYVGHHGGTKEVPQPLNPLTKKNENNGTSVIDVTDPKRPKYLSHIPGEEGFGEQGGAQMVRVCDGKSLPKGDPAKVYLLRTGGTSAQEIWDVSVPEKPSLLTTVVSGLKDTHKNWWECDTGIAYLISDGRPERWRTKRMTKIYDLSDPAHPKFIRNFALVGQQPGSTTEQVPEDTHGPIVLGNRVYFGYGTLLGGVIQIVDREKLLKGNPASKDPFAPTAENLLYPQISRLDMYPTVGAHTTFPVMGMDVPAFDNFHVKSEGFRTGKPAKRDFLVVVNESTQNDCHEDYHMMFMVDITDETRPYNVSNFHVPEKSGNFCARGGRFGSHSSNEDMGPIYYKRMVFVAWFNGGVRAVDIRNPFSPAEVGYYIPEINKNTAKRCTRINGVDRCKIAIQTNNVEVDDRGYVYIVDRAGTGMHILELTGTAKSVANLK